MKKVVILQSVVIFLFYSVFLRSQGEAAVPFMLLPFSPEQSSIGGSGTSLPTDDIFGFLYNPAQLGFTSQKNNFGFISYPGKSNWLSNYDQVTTNAYAFNVGYNFKSLLGVPLSLGIGYARPEMNFGEFIVTDSDIIGSFESRDYFTAWSFGAGIDYYVQFYAGISLKHITSELGYVIIDGERKGIAEVNATDYGFLLNIPVIRLIDDELTFNLIGDSEAKPYFNLSFGTAFSNIGDEIYYIDPAQADPLPRTVRAGYGVSAGIDLPYEKNINFINVAFTVDAEDLLVNPRYENSTDSYQTGFGDIDFGKNIIGIKGDENVISRAGWTLGFMETLVLRTGHFSGRGYRNIMETGGFEIRLKGVFKLFSEYKFLKFAADHIDIRYYKSTYLSGYSLESEISGIALIVSGFEF